MVSFVRTIIKLRLSITNGNHDVMHTTKQSLPTNKHATILSLLNNFDFDSGSSHMFLSFTHSFYCLISTLMVFFALHHEFLSMEI